MSPCMHVVKVVRASVSCWVPLHCNNMMQYAVQISEEFNVAVLVTNQVMSDPSGGAMFVVDPKKPLGGHVMAHASTIRLSLRKGKGEQRVMKVVDSPNLREFLAP